jgi:multiple sugar transport system substrate-binding protein
MHKMLLATASVLSLGLFSGAALADTAAIWVRSGIGDSFKKVVEAFNASHKDQLVTTEVPFSEMVQKYATAIAGGQAPDALSLDLIYNPSFSASGQLEDLTGWAKKLPYFESLTRSHVQLGSYEGKIYGLPLSVETSVFAWNKGLYKKAGLDPNKAPASWDEIVANARKIRALGGDIYGFYYSGGGCGGCNIFTFAPVTWASGADILTADGKKATIDSPAMRKAVDYYRTMVKEGLVPASAATDTGVNFMSFTNGKIGQQSLGAFAIGVLTTQFPEVEFGVTLIPGSTGGASSFAGGDNIVMTKGSKKADIVKSFIEYTYSLDGQKIMAKYGSLPTRGDLAMEVLKDLDPRYQVGVKAISVAKTPYTLQFNELINSANGPWAAFTHAAIYDDADAAFKKAQSEMQEIIENAQ